MSEDRELSERQQQLVVLAAQGLTDKEIGIRLGIAGSTLRTYWIRLRTRLNAKSRTEVIARICADQFAQLQSEHDELLKLVKMLPQFVWTADPSGYVEFCNDWFFRFGGLKPEQCLGIGCSALMLDEDIPFGSARWNKAQETRQAYEAQVRFRCADGTLRWHLIRLLPMLTPSGEVYKWIGTGHELFPQDEKSLSSRAYAGPLDLANSGEY